MARKLSVAQAALASVSATLAALAAGNVSGLSLATYANDAAAKSGGLTAGKLYKTSAGVVMVVL